MYLWLRITIVHVLLGEETDPCARGGDAGTRQLCVVDHHVDCCVQRRITSQYAPYSLERIQDGRAAAEEVAPVMQG